MTATASRTTNRRPELLAPAGGPEPFAAALAAGADLGFSATNKK